MARVIGLTGGIGTGKSTVARLFAERGAQVIDADAIVHELQAPGTPMLAEIAATFGEQFLLPDGALDRKKLGAQVFADPEARAALSRITGGPIVVELHRRVTAARGSDAPLALVDIPLLFEGAARSRQQGGPENPYQVEGVIVVYAPEDQQIERQMERDGATREHALERIGAQMPIEEKRELADWVIDNSGGLEATEQQVDALFRELLTPAV
ncbi:MAG: dephospho-CoA kinase [Deltaproteobacteria bacterium]|jgi:dephospho-CoA kinase|nr:dephospho-CoA kinase [Deltaproteobacteria bacterium]